MDWRVAVQIAILHTRQRSGCWTSLTNASSRTFAERDGVKRSLCVFDPPPLRGLEAGYDVDHRLIGKRVIIELFSLAVTLVELRANIDWKAPF